LETRIVKGDERKEEKELAFGEEGWRLV